MIPEGLGLVFLMLVKGQKANAPIYLTGYEIHLRVNSSSILQTHGSIVKHRMNYMRRKIGCFGERTGIISIPD